MTTVRAEVIIFTTALTELLMNIQVILNVLMKLIAGGTSITAIGMESAMLTTQNKIEVKNLRKIFGRVLPAVFFFLLGFVVSNGVPRAKVEKKLRYNRHAAQKLHDGMDRKSVSLIDGTTYEDFEKENSLYAIYFWATWCPHCRNVKPFIQAFKDSSVPLAGLTFDTDSRKYDEGILDFEPFWSDFFAVSGGGREFVKREGFFNIPSIPSVWIVKDGKVKKIFVGEAQIAKIPEYLKKF